MEIWDLYTIEGKKLDETCIRGEKIPQDAYHIVVHIIIKNSNGEYLIQKRSDEKDLWPGIWAFTGGSAILGETSEMGALRELSEETGIHLVKDDLKFINRLYYKDHFTDIWFGLYDGDVNQLEFQVEEVSALDYRDKEIILKMIENGSFHQYRDDFMTIAMNL